MYGVGAATRTRTALKAGCLSRAVRYHYSTPTHLDNNTLNFNYTVGLRLTFPIFTLLLVSVNEETSLSFG